MSKTKVRTQKPQKKQADTRPVAPKAPGTRAEAPPRMLMTYREKIVPQLTKEFEYENVMGVPRIAKVIVNVGIGEAKDNDKALDAAVGDIVTITGQKPSLIKARKSVAAFKLREGQTIGIKTTLRGRRMWYFLDKLLNVALPRIRDFRGVNPEGFDGRGNYSLGLREQVIFPEIDYDKIDKLRGLEVSIVTTARTDDEARSLLTRLGMPFRKIVGSKEKVWPRKLRWSAGRETLFTRSSRCGFTTAVAFVGGRALSCASSACAASASATLPPRDASLA